MRSRASSRRRTRTTASTALQRRRRRGARRRRRLLGRHARSTRCPRSRVRALVDAAPGATGLPAVDRQRPRTARPRPAWIARRFGVHGHADDGASRASAPRSWSRRCRAHLVAARPVARHRAVSRRSRTRPTRWARRSPGCARCRCRSTTDWHLDLDARRRRRRRARARALAQRPGEPDRRVRVARARCVADGRMGTRPRHRRRQRRVLRRVHLRRPRRAAPRRSPRSSPGTTACSRCTRCRSARTWPGSGPGSSPATPSSCSYLGEVRKHAGLMMPAPVQAAAAAALGDDDARRRAARPLRRAAGARARRRSTTHGLVHDGGPSTFYLWLRVPTGRGRLGDRGPPRRDRRPPRRAGRPLRPRRRRPRAASR